MREFLYCHRQNCDALAGGRGRSKPTIDWRCQRDRRCLQSAKSLHVLVFLVLILAILDTDINKRNTLFSSVKAFVPAHNINQVFLKQHHQSSARHHNVDKISFSFSSARDIAVRRRSITPLSVLRSPNYSRISLESLTVKELRQLLKDSNLSLERGLLSRLKKKKDLVDYLNDHLNNENNEEDRIVPVSKTSMNMDYAKNPKPRIRIRNMPPLPPTTDDDEEGGKEHNFVNHQEKRNLMQDSTNLPEQQPTTTNNTNTTQEQLNLPKKPLSQKEMIYEKLYQQYPPLRDISNLASTIGGVKNCNDVKEDDIRQFNHPIFEGNKNITSSMDIVFIGTASCKPGTTRGVSCTALRLNWNRRTVDANPKRGQQISQQANGFSPGTWLFDAGECTQLQIQRTNAVRPSKINKIFITHAHGDHSFGLPGLLCLMGPERDKNDIVDIYGPEGLRMWLRVALRYSVSRIAPNYRVHEIMDIPMSPEWYYNKRIGRYSYNRRMINNPKRNDPNRKWSLQGVAGEDPTSWITRSKLLDLEPSKAYSEIPGGRDIYPIYDHALASDGAPVWEVEDEGDVKVYAAPMSHGIPCLGYVVEEQSRPGRLRNELVEPIVKRNSDALREIGFKHPMKAMAVIKNLSAGSAFTFPDGTVLTQNEAVELPRRGRKVVICGDTADSSALEVLARDCDVLVHEATNAYINGFDKDTNLQNVTRDTILHGHSTPQLAGQFARKVRAKRLLLNHFSARYTGDASIESLSFMLRIEKQAIDASMLTESKVAAAWDLMVLPIPLPK